MDFRILGPLEARRDGVPVSPGGPKQRALLALLLLYANEPVSHAALIDGLWGDGPPATAAKALQVYVSQLRRQLGHAVVRTHPGGYRLVVEPEALDLLCFEQLVADARVAVPAAAAVKLREALSLWRGAALADVADAAFAQAESGRLEELRLAATEELGEAELMLGHAAELVPELERLVAHNPLRERLRGQLMLALYRSGRQSDALESYQELRRELVEELGLEPGRQLRELHQAILRQDPALDIASPSASSDAHDGAGDDRARPLPAARQARKTVTVVCISLTVLSARGEALDPEALRKLTSRAFGEISGAVEQHGGTLETVAGDSISAVFGLPVLHEDDALRAIRAAVDVRVRLVCVAEEIEAESGHRIGFCVGVSTGEVVTGGDGAVQLRATGVPLGISSRFSRAGAPGEIVVDESTRRLARDAIVVEPVSLDSISAFRVLRAGLVVARHESRLVSPMVGRERERRRLLDAFEQAVDDRSCQLFTVLGSAGVGKSRLVHDFIGTLAGRALVTRGRCLAYGEGITFWPLLEAVKEAVGLDDADSPDNARGKLTQALGDEQSAELLAQRVAETVGLAEVGSAADDGAAAVLTLFQSLARAQPLVLVFDDIHWGESTFLDLVEHLADWARDAPILLVCLARPELLEARPSWGGGKLNATSVLLEPLSDRECALLIENLVGQAELAEEVGAKIVEAAEGNPLFVEEMLSMLIDDGVLVRQDGRWIATGEMPTVRVPPTIQALLATRLDRLDGDERAVIERSAVQGKTLYEDALVELAPEVHGSAITDSLGSLMRKDLIRPGRPSLGGRTYRFRHLLIRDAAYDSIPKETRGETHERFARWLERAAGDRATEYEEILGYHFEQAYSYRAEFGSVNDAARALARTAAERLGSAGRRAFARSDVPAALNLISRAASLLPAEDPLRVELVPNVRVVQGRGTDMTWADRVLTEAIEAATASGDRRLGAHALVQRGLLRLFTVSDVTAEELLDAAERAISVFAELGDELGLARAWRLSGQAHYLAHRAASCAYSSEQALKHVRLAGDPFEEREVIEWLVIALLLGPSPAPAAAERCERLLSETATDTLLQAQIAGVLACLVAMQGDWNRADELITRSRALMDEAGEQIWIVSFWFAYCQLWRGDSIAAEQELRPGYAALMQLGEKSHFSSMAHLLATALYVQGRDDEAERLTRECEEASRPNDVHSQILWRSTRAKLLARRGEFEAAEELGREAVAFAAGSDFSLAHADALTDLAEVLELGSHSERAADALRGAFALHEQKGNLVAAEHALARLDRIKSPTS